MDFFQIILLGLTQGITEWVPISSKTQDTFVYLTFLHGSQSSVIPILLYLHIGTVLAAMIYFRKEIISIFSEFAKRPLDIGAHSKGKSGFLFVSLLFTGIVGLPIYFLERKLFPSIEGGLLFAIMGAGLLFTGVLLLRQKGSRERSVKDADWKDGILTGALQGLSILPGVSRAGTSTSALIWRGFDSESSFYLSFLLSIPTVILAELLLDYAGGLSSFPLSDGVMLSVSSFVFGYLTLDAILRIVKRVNLAYVAFALGLIMVCAGLFGLG